jgi:hypothetical protein
MNEHNNPFGAASRIGVEEMNTLYQHVRENPEHLQKASGDSHAPTVGVRRLFAAAVWSSRTIGCGLRYDVLEFYQRAGAVGGHYHAVVYFD